MDIKKILEGGNPYLNKRVGQGESGGVSGASKSGKSAAASGKSDTISLSDDAKLVGLAAKEARSAPEVRADRVAELKAKVQSGEYQPDSRVIAEKLLMSEADFL